jgi:hypothetical protein
LASYAFKLLPGRIIQQAKALHGALDKKRSYHRAVHLWVFEVDFCKAWWMKVKNLGDQVLFLYRNFSMEFTVGLSEHWGSLF